MKQYSSYLYLFFITTYKCRCLHKREGCINKPTDARTNCSYPPGYIIPSSTIGSLEKDIAVKEMPHQIRQEEQSMSQTSLPSIQFCTIDVDKQYPCHQYNYRSPGLKDVDHSKIPQNFIHLFFYILYI